MIHASRAYLWRAFCAHARRLVAFFMCDFNRCLARAVLGAIPYPEPRAVVAVPQRTLTRSRRTMLTRSVIARTLTRASTGVSQFVEANL